MVNARPRSPLRWYQFGLRSLLIFVALVVLGLAAWHTYVERYPHGWDRDALTRAALRKGDVAKETRILIWETVEGPMTPMGPVYVESCIVWVRLRNGGHVVAHLFREPRHEQPQWKLSIVMDDRSYAPRRVFDRAPTNDDIYQFLHDTGWKFAPEQGFHFVDVAVSIEDWKAVTGQYPSTLYENQTVKRGN
jgi:hypothetical protein